MTEKQTETTPVEQQAARGGASQAEAVGSSVPLQVQRLSLASARVLRHLQGKAGNRAVTAALRKPGRRSGLEGAASELGALVGGSSGVGVGSLGKSTFAEVHRAVVGYNRAVGQGASDTLASALLARIDELATTWDASHRSERQGDRGRAVRRLLENVWEERRTVTAAAAQDRYMGDLVSGQSEHGSSDPTATYATSATPMLAASQTARLAGAEHMDHQRHLTRLADMGGFFQQDQAREYGAIEEAVALGLTSAELAAIKVFTAGDYQYINPAIQGSRSWMAAKTANIKTENAMMAKPATGYANTAEEEKSPPRGATGQQLEMSGDERWHNVLMQEGALHAALATRGLSKLPPYRGPTYRGEGLTMTPRTHGGDEDLTLLNLTSTSTDLEVAIGFLQKSTSATRPVGVIWVYTGGGGSDIRGLSAVQAESEVLVPAGSRYWITHVEEVTPTGRPPSGPAATAFGRLQSKMPNLPAGSKLYVVVAEYVGGGVHKPFQDQANDQTGQAAAGAGVGVPPGRSDAGDMLRFAAMVKARQILRAAAAVEPTVTSDIKGVSTSRGGKLAGLEHRFKTDASLARKLEDRARTRVSSAVPPEQAVQAEAAKVNDALRYTIVMRPDAYKDLTDDIGPDLKGRGYTIINVNNAWAASDTYKGHNLTFLTPADTPNPIQFEVQVHTDETFATKQDIHDLYEEARASGTTPARRAELNDAMAARWRQVEVPAGIYNKPPAT